MSRDKYGHYVNDSGVEIKASTSSSGKDKIDIYDKCAADPTHKSIHINFDSEKGTGTITDTTGDETETTDVSCFLTTACIKYFQKDFDDNCEELTILRWFRDNFVSSQDIEHYYEIAPIIVETINNIENNDSIYNYIYHNVVKTCVDAIKNGDYKFAYDRYKNSVLALEEQFARPTLEKKLIKILKLKENN